LKPHRRHGCGSIPASCCRRTTILAREACFLEFAGDIKVVARKSVMITGGIRRRPIVKQVLGTGVGMVSMALGRAAIGSLAMPSIAPAKPRPVILRSWRWRPNRKQCHRARLWERILPKTFARLTGGLFFSSRGARLIVNPIRELVDSGQELP
jgi:hypothetical protein